MNRMTLLTTTLLGLAVAGASYADGLRPARSNAGAARVVPSSGGKHCTGRMNILYEQDPTTTSQADSGIAVVSQNFETALDAYDSEAADDFVVTPTSPFPYWKIKEVDVTGQYFNANPLSGPAASETVTFYKNAGGVPGATIASFVGVVGVDSNGSFCIPIKPALKLKKGHYWVSVVANMDYNPNGEWGWENLVPPAVLLPAQWRNPPPNGFTVCPMWGTENVCIPDGQGDHIFTIRGVP